MKKTILFFLCTLTVRTVLAQRPASMPDYDATHQVKGVIRNFGSDLAGVVKAWEKEFIKVQPDVRFNDNLAGSDAAILGLATGAFDLAPNGREAQLIEYLGYYEVFNANPYEVMVGTGAYDIPGRTWAEIIYVHKDNPLTRLTMQQLDDIFGEGRTGTIKGLVLSREGARSAAENIRTWGQLGLKGEWKNKPIQTYGYGPTGMTSFFQLKVMHGSDKWNPNYREYAESGTKMIDPKLSVGLGSRDMLADLSRDRYGIGWSGIGQAKAVPGLKILALAEHPGSPYIYPSLETVANRTYPLTRSIFIYLNHQPGQPLDPKLKEFLFFVLSRQGQDVLAQQGEYLPLPAEKAIEERRRLTE